MVRVRPWLALGLISAAALCSAADAPQFKVTGTDGAVYTHKSFGKKPALVVFLNNTCPHSRMAAPDLNRLHKLLAGKVQVIAITNLALREAKKYAKDIKADFPLLPDPKKTLIKAFGAKFSLDMTVIVGAEKPTFPKKWRAIPKPG